MATAEFSRFAGILSAGQHYFHLTDEKPETSSDDKKKKKVPKVI